MDYGYTPYDIDNCFHIRDFYINDCVEIMVAGKLIRGYVHRINAVENYILWSDGKRTRKAGMNEVRYLKPHEKGWV